MKGNMHTLAKVMMAAVMTVFVVASVAPAWGADADGDGVDDAIDVCPGTVIPEPNVPTQQLKVDHFTLTNADTTFDTVAPAQATFTTADTAGCSCEQIIVQDELGEGHSKFGCSLTAMQEFIASLQPGGIFPGDGVDGPALSYQDNGDGTITDLNTGLMWEKKDNNAASLHYVNATFTFNAATTTWIDAVNVEGGTGFAGFNDWRLANVRELPSVVDYGQSNPAIDPIFGPTAASFYWSSTTSAIFPTLAWGVVFFFGNVGRAGKNFPLRVRAVRGGR